MNLRTWVIAAGLLAGGSPAFGQFVTNGSFEADAPHNWPGGGPITGWTGGSGLNPSVGTPACCGQSPFAPDNDGGDPSLLSPDGGQFAFLQSNGTTMSQTLTGLTPGAQYELRYYDAHRNGDQGTTALLQASVDGVVVASNNPSTSAWNERVATFTPAGTSAVLTFTDVNAANNDQTVDVDGVRVTAVPEPGSVGLGLGAAGLLGLARRRRPAR